MDLQAVTSKLDKVDRGFATLGGLFLVAPVPALPGPSFSTLSVTGTEARYCRYSPPVDLRVTAITWLLTTVAGGAQAPDVGIMDAAGAKLASSGATDAAATVLGTKTTALSAAVNLYAGLFYHVALAWPALNGTPAVAALALSTTQVSDVVGTAIGQRLVGSEASATVPASMGAQTVRSAIPAMWLNATLL